MDNRVENTKDTQPQGLSDMAGRQAGKAVLKDVIHRLRHKARAFETILNMLPEQPTQEQDQALWTLFVSLEVH